MEEEKQILAKENFIKKQTLEQDITLDTDQDFLNEKNERIKRDFIETLQGDQCFQNMNDCKQYSSQNSNSSCQDEVAELYQDHDKLLYEQIREQLDCSICREVFKQPQVLPCKHTFCKECLRTNMTIQVQKSIYARCPLCNNDFNHRNISRIPVLSNICDILIQYREKTNTYTQLPFLQQKQKRGKTQKINQNQLENKNAQIKEVPQIKQKSKRSQSRSNKPDHESDTQEKQNLKKVTIREEIKEEKKQQSKRSRVTKSSNKSNRSKSQDSKSSTQKQQQVERSRSAKPKQSKKRKLSQVNFKQQNSYSHKRLQQTQRSKLLNKEMIYIYSTQLHPQQQRDLQKLTIQFPNLKYEKEKEEIDISFKEQKILIVENHGVLLTTTKNLQAIAFNIPIVSIQWVKDCLKSKDQLSFSEYQSSQSGDVSNLFKNFKFTFKNERKLYKCQMNLSSIKQIIKQCGGTILTNLNKNEQELYLVMIGYDPNFTKQNKAHQSKIKKQVEQLNCNDTVDLRWIMHSITFNEIQHVSDYIINR